MCAPAASQQLANILPRHCATEWEERGRSGVRESAPAQAVPSGAVNVLAGRWTSTGRHPETRPAVARGRKSTGVGVSAPAQGDQAPAVLGGAVLCGKRTLRLASERSPRTR